ncbi:YcnI family protein [Psychromicrobium xiongbiense]|uniref:YcnI family copper-binding membrane protein n=1 Tax=Psychromicrobium xiongbiense TaxID=3051184 RepID=UPI0025563067|nr:YcnI family protein [Psychromicrobium sp. YIM S02556]
MNNSLRRALLSAAGSTLAAALLVMGAGAASAHVKVAPDDAAANGYTQLTFTVPNELDRAKTNKLEVSLPMDTPLMSVSAKQIEGWTVQVVTGDLPKPVTISGSTVTKAPLSVIWTADASHAIGQGQYQTFALSVGKLPGAGTTLTLPAVQTYDDGTVVKWDQKTVPGQAEPEHPAPSFVTTAGPGATSVPSTTHSVSAPAVGAPAAASSDGQASGWAVFLGIVGVLLGGTALTLVLLGRRRPSAAA